MAETKTKKPKMKSLADVPGAGTAGLASRIAIPGLNLKAIRIKIRGKEGSPMVQHQWSQKAKEEMAAKGGAKVKKPPRNPAEAFTRSIHYVGEPPKENDTKLAPGAQPGIPPAAFKKAMVGAVRNLNDKSVPMTLVRQSIFILGDIIPIMFGECRMREDIVRVSNGQPDIRYRAQFDDWSCEVPIEYDGNIFQAEDVVNLMNLAGSYVGVLEGRPERSSGLDWGRFEIVQGEQSL